MKLAKLDSPIWLRELSGGIGQRSERDFTCSCSANKMHHLIAKHFFTMDLEFSRKLMRRRGTTWSLESLAIGSQTEASLPVVKLVIALRM